MRKFVESGYQLGPGAYERLQEFQGPSLNLLVEKALAMARASEPRPLVIERELIENAAASVSQPVQEEAAGSTWKPLAKDVEARLEVVKDPTGKIGSDGTVEDFHRYFASRFQKLRKILMERMDARDAETLGRALSVEQGKRAKFIAMVMEKRAKEARIILQVDDLENSAAVLISRDKGREIFESGQRLALDQVICVEALRGKGEFFIAEKFVLPDIPERKPSVADEAIYAALISDIHVGSSTFLEETFSRLIRWLNGEVGNSKQAEKAGQVKYLLIGGDLVDGVGVYPGQEAALKVKDVYEQYRYAAKFIGQVPDYIKVIMIPGNHDATRQALPQPAIPREFGEPVYESRELVSLGDPAEVRLHEVHFLMYHGRSLDDVIATIPGLSFQTVEKAMAFLLRCRHLAPEFGKRTPIAPEADDYLVIEVPPDVMHSGHIHVARYENYRGTLILNSGTWQSQTDYQRKMGLAPTPGILTLVNLQTLQPEMIKF